MGSHATGWMMTSGQYNYITFPKTVTDMTKWVHKTNQSDVEVSLTILPITDAATLPSHPPYMRLEWA
jgi:hypothetical protein